MRALRAGRCLGPILALAWAAPCCQAQSAPCGLTVPSGRAYSLKLTSFVPEANHASGALLEARIDGGPPLHLLLDSGAAHITLDAKASARSGIAAVAESRLIGVGGSPARVARTGIAAAVDAGPLRFVDCRVDMAAGRLAAGIDGVVPTSLFGGFLIRLDLRGMALDLTPLPPRGEGWTAGFESAIGREGLLFLPGSVNGAPRGYILLDTGSCYSAVSREAARALQVPLLSMLDLRSPNGPAQAGLIAGPIRFQVAGRSLTAEPAVALDLSAFSAWNGVETSGVLGYPTLHSSVLTIDYRDRLVRIDAPAFR